MHSLVPSLTKAVNSSIVTAITVHWCSKTTGSYDTFTAPATTNVAPCNSSHPGTKEGIVERDACFVKVAGHDENIHCSLKYIYLPEVCPNCLHTTLASLLVHRLFPRCCHHTIQQYLLLGMSHQPAEHLHADTLTEK